MPDSRNHSLRHPGPGRAAASATALDGNGRGPGDGSSTDGTGSEGAAPTRRVRAPGPTVWPAAIVLGVALVVVITAGVAAVMTSGPVATSATAPRVVQAAGAPVAAVTAQDALAPIITPGLPPANVVDAVVVPTGATVSPGSATDLGVGLYDRSLAFSTPLSEEAVITFYRAELPAEGWKVISQGAPRDAPGFEILGQIAGTDGYYWEIGVTVSPTAYPRGSASSATGSTGFTLRLFAVDDAT